MLKQVQHDTKEGEDHVPVPVGTGLQDDSKKSKSGIAEHFAVVLIKSSSRTFLFIVILAHRAGIQRKKRAQTQNDNKFLEISEIKDFEDDGGEPVYLISVLDFYPFSPYIM